VDQLRREGAAGEKVLGALARVPREVFIPLELRHRAYEDEALPIDAGQTISQPTVVAHMTEALALSPVHRVLEIGTGSGYQAAVLAELAREVITIERHALLAEQARETLAYLGYDNVRVVVGDGTLGWPDEAPYDASRALTPGRAARTWRAAGAAGWWKERSAVVARHEGRARAAQRADARLRALRPTDRRTGLV
jgi:protein-L-isoaspartate(D-aspartate) O-methyltransferase